MEMLEPPQREKGDELDEREEPAPLDLKKARPANLREYSIKAECFDLWVFGALSEEDRKLWLLAALSAQVVNARKMSLSAAEEQKLILAGHGDIKRFFDRIEAGRADFEVARKELTSGQIFLLKIAGGSYRTEFVQGPFGNGSLFSKTLEKIANEPVAEGLR
jgi:hypothetical protein